MKPLEPNTRTRLSVAELKGVQLAGSPSSAACADMRSGESKELTAPFDLTTSASPNILEVSWEMDGVTVACEVEVVSSRYCTLDDIQTYRSDEYENEHAPKDDVFEARQRAESIIESAANRLFQPVLRRAFVDRPGCTTRTQAISDTGSIVHDVLEVAGAKLFDGTAADVRPVRRGSQFLDVSGVPRGEAAEVLLVCGMSPTPPEARSAVRELAAWFLASHMEPDNALSVSNESGVVHFVVSGVNGDTPLPEANALISRYERRDMVIG